MLLVIGASAWKQISYNFLFFLAGMQAMPFTKPPMGELVLVYEGEGLKAVSVGPPEFRERLRRATGRTLHRPTLTERLRPHGGAVIYSNSSAGSAHMQDPDSHGWLFHRNGSFAPGMQAITDERHLDVGYDADGDAETTRRFW